ncbi:MAG: TonB-dependent receptor [Cyanobacteria bacterium P01_D01_bin.115]
MTTQIKLVGYSALASLILAGTHHPAEAQVSTSAAHLEDVETAVAGEIADGVPTVAEAAPLPSEEHRGAAALRDQSIDPQSEQPPGGQIVQGETAVITDVQISETPDGLRLVLVSEQPLSAGPAQISGNAVVTEIANATLELTDEAAAQQFAPAEGIALVQVSSLPNGNVQVAITGTDAPPEAEVTVDAGNVIFTVVPGIAGAQVEDPDAIQVVVTATRTEEAVIDLPRSVTVIEREQIEQQTELTNNLPDILGQLVPGLSPPPLQATTRGFTLRGRNALILIDGVPQGGNSSTQRALNGIAPEFIERVEVVPGASAIFGDGATGGIINIITRVPVEEGAIYDLSVGTRVGVTAIEGDSFSYNFRVGAAAADGPVDGRFSFTYDIDNARFDADGDRIPPTGAGENDELGLLAKVGYDIDEQQRLELTYSYSQRVSNTEFATDLSIFQIPGTQVARAIRIGSFDYERDPKSTNQFINLTYRNTDVLGSQVDAQLYYSDEESAGEFTDLRDRDFEEFFPDVWQSLSDISEFGARLQIDTPIGNAAGLLWGVDYSQEDNEVAASFIDPVALETEREVNAIEEFSLFPPYELENLGLFAQARWDITEQWQISGGIRYDDFNFSVDDYALAFRFPREREGGSGSTDGVSFNAGLLYRPIPEVGLFANFSQGFSIPNLGSVFSGATETFSVEDNLSLEPQTVDNFEVGVRAEFGQVQASLAGFYSESDLGSFIRFNQDTGFSELLRAPQRNYGLEAAVDWQPSEVWRLGGYFSWSEGESDNDDDGEFEALGSLNVPPYQIGLYVENDTTPTWSNRLQMLLVGDRDSAFDDGVDAFDIDSYVTLDFISSLQLGQGRLTLGIENLLNTDYLPLTSQERVGRFEERRFAAPGTTVSLRYSITF